MSLDERTLRRPDWYGGRPVRLADGQEWLLPRPDVLLEPTGEPDGAATVATVPPISLDLAARVADTPLADGQGVDLGPIYELGRALLQANYTLTDDQAETLFQFADMDAMSTTVRTIIGVARRVTVDAMPLAAARIQRLETTCQAILARLDQLGVESPT